MIKNKGVLFGFTAYLLWGILPIYFKIIQAVPADQIVFHRVVWSFLLLGVLISVRKGWKPVLQALTQPKTLALYVLAGLLLAVNWLTYVWGVNAGHIVETSLGYFINPLVSVALGVIVLRERLRPLQWLPVLLAAGGVLYLTLQYGALPWIALVLAFSFGLYGLVKKLSPLGSLHGLTLETGILFLPSIAYLLFAEVQGQGAFGHLSPGMNLLLALSGVITTLPLLLFSSAARSIPLTLIGLLQYIAPTGQFLIGVLVYKEPFTPVQMIGFGIIWLALIIFSLEGYSHHRRIVLNAREALKA